MFSLFILLLRNMQKIIFVPKNPIMSDFLNTLLVRNIFKDDKYFSKVSLETFLEWLENLDCYKKEESNFYETFYYYFKATCEKNKRLAMWLSDNIANWHYWYDFFENEIFQFEKDYFKFLNK